MPETDIALAAQQWIQDGFVWIGFGTMAGLMAKAIMPGRDPGGTVATLAMGMGGAVVGCGILAFFVPAYRVAPLSPIGFVVATGGAFVLLFFYRLLAGRYFREGGDGHVPAPYFRRRAYRRRRMSVYDDGPYVE